RAMGPARREPEGGAGPRGLPLQQIDLAAVRSASVGPRQQSARGAQRHVDAPLSAIFARRRFRVCRAACGEECRHVEADAAGADDGDALARNTLSTQQLRIRDDFRMLDAGNSGNARANTGGEHDVIERSFDERCARGRRAQSQIDTEQLDPPPEVTQSFAEFFLARYFPSEAELAADLGTLLEQRDSMPTLGGRHSARKPR